jgi:hypothetical protein
LETTDFVRRFERISGPGQPGKEMLAEKNLKKWTGPPLLQARASFLGWAGIKPGNSRIFKGRLHGLSGKESLCQSLFQTYPSILGDRRINRPTPRLNPNLRLEKSLLGHSWNFKIMRRRDFLRTMRLSERMGRWKINNIGEPPKRLFSAFRERREKSPRQNRRDE